MVNRVVIGKVEDIPPGDRKIVVPFRGRAGIGVFNVGGSFHAIRNICPHKTGPLCTGEITGRVKTIAPPSTGSAFEIEDDGALLHCPWHQWSFEIATGQCLVEPSVRVKTYPVKIENGKVVVSYDD